jgi:FKBP-type peptidyl-prolyl cis-trans isomerase SlyD
MNGKPYIISNDVVVSLNYILTVNGEVVDSTLGGSPIRFIHGRSHIIPALEQQLQGMTIGESKDIFIPADEGYGEYDPGMVSNITRDQFPEGFVFVLGGQLRIQDISGTTFNATIMSISADSVQLDLNHPLAGKDLLFNTTVVDLREATEEEIENGLEDF